VSVLTHRPARGLIAAGAGVLIAGSAALLLAPPAGASTARPPAPTLPRAPHSRAALAPTQTPVPSGSLGTPAAPSSSAAPTRVSVPAGGGAAPADRAAFGPTEIALVASGLLLVAGGAVALRRQYR